MRVQRNSGISFQKFIVDDKGKTFLAGLYDVTKPKAHDLLTNELRIFKQNMSSYSNVMEEEGIDIVFTSYPSRPNLSEMPSLQLQKQGKLLKDTINVPSELLLLELQHDKTTKKSWNKLDVKKWFNRANAETNGWFTLNYVDRFNTPKKSINALIAEAQKPITKKEIIEAIFD